MMHDLLVFIRDECCIPTLHCQGDYVQQQPDILHQVSKNRTEQNRTGKGKHERREKEGKLKDANKNKRKGREQRKKIREQKRRGKKTTKKSIQKGLKVKENDTVKPV